MINECKKIFPIFIELCGNHIKEITFGSGIVLLSIVGIQYMFFAIAIWLLCASIDVAIGFTKSKIINDNYDSRIFGKSLLKRSMVAVVGGLLAIIFWHLAALSNERLRTIVFGIAPICYFHLFSLQELTSIMEHWIDIDPDNRGTQQIRKIINVFKKNVEQGIDKNITRISGMVYDYLSPNVGKKYLHRIK